MTEPFYVEWSEEALADLAQRIDFLSERSPSAAERAGTAIVDAADKLADFPNMGRMYPRDPTQREVLIPFGNGGYSLLYRIDGNVVLITNLKHQRQASY